MNRWRDRSRCRRVGTGLPRSRGGHVLSARPRTARPVPIGERPGRYVCDSRDGCVRRGCADDGSAGDRRRHAIGRRRAASGQGRRRRGHPDRGHGLARGARRRRRQRRVAQGRQPRPRPPRPHGADGAGHRPLRGRRRRRRAGAVDVPRRRVERPVGHVAQRRHQEARRRARAPRSSPTTWRSARGCCSGWAAVPPSARTATCSSARPTRCATPRCRCTPGSRPRCSRPCTRS